MNSRKLYHSWYVNRNVQNKPYVTLLHLQGVIIFSTWSKLNSVFLIKLSTCDFQVRLPSRCMPKNLIFSVRVQCWLLYTLFNGYVRSLEEANFTICVLFKFSTNWRFWNHLEMQHSTGFSFKFTSLRSLEKTRILVSSAKKCYKKFCLWCMENP